MTAAVTSLEAKIVAAIGAILSVVFAIHPGWNQSGLTSGIESAATALIGGAVYIVHLFTSRKVATAPVAPVKAAVAPVTSTTTTAGTTKA